MDRRTNIWTPGNTDPVTELVQENAAPVLRLRSEFGGPALEVLDAGGLHQLSGTGLSPNALAESLGLVAWTFHPSSAAFAGTQANVHIVAVWLPGGKTISKMAVPVTIIGAGMTNAQLGVYDATLTAPVAQSANSPGAFQAATGWVELSMAPAYTTPAPGLYYFASAYSTATTLPTVLNIKQDNAVGLALPGGAFHAIHAQAQGTLPNPPVSNGAFTNVPLIIAR